MQAAVVPVLLFVACAIGVAVGLLTLVNFFNPGRHIQAKQIPYESGMDPVHDTRRRFTVRFHLIAIAFLVFEVELLFLYPWAVAAYPSPMARSPTTSEAVAVPAIPRGIDAAVAADWVQSRGLVFAAVMIFFLVLILGFLYDWRKGVFRWE